MNTLKYEDMREAVQRAEINFECDLEDVIYADYSGRSMYGRECFGLVVNRDADFTLIMLALADHLAEENEDDEYMARDTVRELVDNLRTDNLGMSTIFYFPSWTLEGAPEDKEEED